MAETRRTILIVDDTHENIAVLSAILKDFYRVKFATSGAMALALAEAEDKPSLILLDLVMPVMDGLATCRALKANPRTADIPVVFVTARSEMEDEEAGFTAGAVDYLIKPISAPILLARVRTQIALREAIVSAEEADRAKSMFLATMSHEIRTPMNGIMSMAELLDGSGMSAEQNDMVRLIRRSAGTLLTIIEGILDFSKIEAGRLDIEDTEFGLVELFETVGDILRPRSDEKALAFLLDLDPALPVRARGDATRLQQILINLAGNAIKFTETGTVVLRARAVAQGDGGPGLAVEVVDSGLGISAEQQAALFRPFVQADSSTARKYGGTGLGLAISQRLCNLMGGAIGIESQPGVGSRFHFEIPLAVADGVPEMPDAEVSDISVAAVGFSGSQRTALASLLAAVGVSDVRWPDRTGASDADVIVADAARDDLRPGGAQPLILLGSAVTVRNALWPAFGSISWPVRRARLRYLLAAAVGRAAKDAGALTVAAVEEAWSAGPRADADAQRAVILVADDDETNRAVLRGYFARWGYHADFARDGEEALSLFNPAKHGLLLVDMHMPRLDGVGLARAIRASGADGLQVPMVAVTADAMVATRQRALEAGMNGWLTKPIDSAALRKVIASWLPQAVALRRASAQEKGALPADLQAVDPAIFDWSRVIEPFGGWTEEARDFTRDFLGDLPAKLNPLAQAMEAGDHEGARFAAHALKGAARVAGAMRLGQVAGDVQDCLDAGDIAMARTFESLLKITLVELEDVLEPIVGGKAVT